MAKRGQPEQSAPKVSAEHPPRRSRLHRGARGVERSLQGRSGCGFRQPSDRDRYLPPGDGDSAETRVLGDSSRSAFGQNRVLPIRVLAVAVAAVTKCLTPPKKAEVKTDTPKKISVPAPKEPTPEIKPRPPPVETLNIPAVPWPRPGDIAWRDRIQRVHRVNGCGQYLVLGRARAQDWVQGSAAALAEEPIAPVTA